MTLVGVCRVIKRRDLLQTTSGCRTFLVSSNLITSLKTSAHGIISSLARLFKSIDLIIRLSVSIVAVEWQPRFFVADLSQLPSVRIDNHPNKRTSVMSSELSNRASASSFLPIRGRIAGSIPAVVFAGDEASVPVQESLGTEHRGKPTHALAAQLLGFSRQPSSLVVVEAWLFAQLLLQDFHLFLKVFNGQLLVAVEPAGKKQICKNCRVDLSTTFAMCSQDCPA
jgi:hypothetical protein